ncbi:MAG: hypothetical protein RIT81_31995 [Deltaproteobacteria bacterium]
MDENAAKLLARVAAWVTEQSGRPEAPEAFPDEILELATVERVRSLLGVEFGYLPRIGLLLLFEHLAPPYAELRDAFHEGLRLGDVSAIKHDIRILGPHIQRCDIERILEDIAATDNDQADGIVYWLNRTPL